VPLLHRLGFSYKKTKLVPCEADLSQHNTRSSYAWIPKGEEKELPSVSGRQRLNCNGAINPFEVRDMEVRFDTCINAQSTWLLYKQLEEKHSDKACIYVVCDNARYYKNKWLQEQLQGSKIKQIFSLRIHQI
jgi:hypothetical protein